MEEKAEFSIAQALEEILDGRITRGVINVKKGESQIKPVEVCESGYLCLRKWV